MDNYSELLSYMTDIRDRGITIGPIVNVNDLDKKLDFLMGMRNITFNKQIPKKDKFVDDMIVLGVNYPPPLKYSKDIEIRDSKLHGKGVFAKTHIPKNTIITFYPAHAIGLNDDLIIANADLDFSKVIKKCKYDKLYGTSDYSYDYNFLNLIGNPKQIDNELLLGHMLNDAVGNIFSNISYENIQNTLLFKNTTSKYIIWGTKKRNCIIQYHMKYPLAYILTTRDIMKDEELLIMYGSTYWFDHTYEKNCEQDSEYEKLLKEICDEEYITWLISMLPEFRERIKNKLLKNNLNAYKKIDK